MAFLDSNFLGPEEIFTTQIKRLDQGLHGHFGVADVLPEAEDPPIHPTVAWEDASLDQMKRRVPFGRMDHRVGAVCERHLAVGQLRDI